MWQSLPVDNPYPSPVRHLDSVTELIQAVKNGKRAMSYNDSTSYESSVNSGKWMSAGLSFEECEQRARFGDNSIVARAESLLEKLDKPEIIDYSYASSVQGAYPVVPEYLAGFPECMREKRISETETGPIRVFASQFVSASVSPEDAMKRGVAITALIMRLQMTHSVELFLVSARLAQYDRESSRQELKQRELKPLLKMIRAAGVGRL